MKTKLDPQEQARRQAWRTAHVEARDQVAAAKTRRSDAARPSPHSTRKGRAALAVLSAASVIAGIEAPRV